jgi:transcriptional regulator with XRE-family HTH domain
MEGRPTLGQAIRSRRLELDLTQEELAERIGDNVRQAEVSRLERDRVTLPRRRRLERIAAALDLPLGELLAKAGWAGAATAFSTSSEPPVPAAPDTPTPPLADPFSGWWAPPGSMADQLRAALERSESVRARTRQLLDESASLSKSWSFGADRGHHGADPLPTDEAGDADDA